MPDKDQCPAHTRTSWGASPHLYSPRLRYFFMGLLLTLFFAVIVCTVVSLIALPRTGKGDDQLDDVVETAVNRFKY